MIRRAIRKATIDNLMVPVVCGTSYKNKGVQKLLDAIVDLSLIHIWWRLWRGRLPTSRPR